MIVNSFLLCFMDVFELDYGDQTADLDVVIIGGYFGEGKSTRGKGISSFLCAVKATPVENQPPQFLSICKVGTSHLVREID